MRRIPSFIRPGSDTDVILVWLLAALALVPLLSLPLTGSIGPKTGYPVGVVFLGIAAGLIPAARRVIAGEVIHYQVPWVAQLDLDLTLRLDGLSLVFIALALIIGALVFFYSPGYFLRGNQRGFYLIMTGFTFAMVAFVLSDNLILMFLTWELTSLASFLLIARSGQAGEPASMRTMLMTFIGGMTLLAAVGLIIAKVGTADFSEAMASDVWQTEPVFTAVVATLVAIAGFSKAAQFPFHLWLPDAMAAATPVSAYLHAAAVVKAGIYLLMRFTAFFHGVPTWQVLLIGVGLLTTCLGAWFALQQTDLKKLMAYSTVSQLGLITATIGVGTEFALAAALLHTIAHACFKSGLFMLMGIVDHQAGTRKIDRLPALRRAMPWTFWATVIGLASMAGVPPMLGFVSKEMVLTSFFEIGGGLSWLVFGIAAFGAVLTFCYSGKILTGAFIDGERPEPDVREGSWRVVVPAAIPIVIGLPLALVVGALESPIWAGINALFPGESEPVSIYLWHGITIELVTTLLIFAVGSALVLRRARLRPLVERPTFGKDGAAVVADIREQVARVGVWLEGLTRFDYPSRHIAPMMVSLAVLTGSGSAALWLTDNVAPLQSGLNRPIDLGLFVIAAVGVVALARSSSRLGAAVLMGGVGIAMTVQIFMLGAPDVGLTQLLVEVLTVLVIMLVLRKLPLEFSYGRHPKKRRNALIAIGVGALTTFAAYTMLGRRERSDIGDYYVEHGAEITGGDNLVNVILVEFRALDTLGELTVLGMAGIAIVAVLSTIPSRFLDPKPDPSPESPVAYVPEPVIEIDVEGSRAYDALENVEANTEPLRLLQVPLIPVLAIISAVLFWRGHNEPGGGFIAALVAACAVAYIYMAKPVAGAVSRPRTPALLIGAGVIVAVGSGILGYLAGDFLHPVYTYVGGIKWLSSMLFDLGVFAAVLGLVMVAFNVLGSSGREKSEHLRQSRPTLTRATSERREGVDG